MDCAAIGDFASLIQFGAGLNLGVSILYHVYEAHLSRLHHKLKVLEASGSLLSAENAILFRRERQRLCREVEIAAKSLDLPTTILVSFLLFCGGYCVVLLIFVGFNPKSCDPFWVYSGIVASIIPVPLGFLIHQFLVRYKFDQCRLDIEALEKSYFG